MIHGYMIHRYPSRVMCPGLAKSQGSGPERRIAGRKPLFERYKASVLTGSGQKLQNPKSRKSSNLKLQLKGVPKRENSGHPARQPLMEPAAVPAALVRV
jgi:hypothetical protein